MTQETVPREWWEKLKEFSEAERTRWFEIMQIGPSKSEAKARWIALCTLADCIERIEGEYGNDS